MLSAQRTKKQDNNSFTKKKDLSYVELEKKKVFPLSLSHSEKKKSKVEFVVCHTHRMRIG